MVTNSKTGMLSILNVAILFSFPTPCQAAGAKLPWDFTLAALENVFVDIVAPWAVGYAFVTSLVLYAIGGQDETAGRLFGSGIGGLIILPWFTSSITSPSDPSAAIQNPQLGGSL